MFLRYQVSVNGQFKGEIHALSEQSAKEKAYNVFGSASRYSGVGYDSIEVTRA